MAVIVTGTLLLIVYALSNISLKELILTQSGKDSQIAFYAADAGVECAMFWDLKNPGSAGGNSAFDPSIGGNVIFCNGNTIKSDLEVPTVPNTTTSVVGGGGTPTSTFYINLTPTLDDGTGPCAIVRVGKHQIGPVGGIGSYIRTVILSRGYNTCDTGNPRRFERGLRVIY